MKPPFGRGTTPVRGLHIHWIMTIITMISSATATIITNQNYWSWKKSCTSWYCKYTIIYKVLDISTGAGFLPTILTTLGPGNRLLFWVQSQTFWSLDPGNLGNASPVVFTPRKCDEWIHQNQGPCQNVSLGSTPRLSNRSLYTFG